MIGKGSAPPVVPPSNGKASDALAKAAREAYEAARAHSNDGWRLYGGADGAASTLKTLLVSINSGFFPHLARSECIRLAMVALMCAAALSEPSEGSSKQPSLPGV